MLEEAITMIREEILGDNKAIKQEFQLNFSTEIDSFIQALANAVVVWKNLDDSKSNNTRKPACSAFVYVTITTLLLSMKLLIEGYLIASGNLLRQVAECMPMPLLLACEELNIYERFEKNQYSTNKSIQDAIRNSNKLSVIKDALENLKEIQKWYDCYSHPSKGTLAAYIPFDGQKGLYVGVSFDKGKIDAYKKEIILRVDMAEGIPNIVQGTLKKLKML